ncbi:30S ribosomal protein S2 [Microbacterium sp.]|uniref:30S ribosomal protein S2 n=1 Tax=Microbacterium sp. TaxID=51671 RepID=UPI003A94CAB6
MCRTDRLGAPSLYTGGHPKSVTACQERLRRGIHYGPSLEGGVRRVPGCRCDRRDKPQGASAETGDDHGCGHHPHLLDSGVHFGHQTRRWNPKVKRFILTERRHPHHRPAAVAGVHRPRRLRQGDCRPRHDLFVGTKQSAGGPHTARPWDSPSSTSAGWVVC